MSESDQQGTSRRQFLHSTGRIAAATALASMAVPAVHAGEDHTIRVALVGCGGRGAGAAVNALSTKSGPIQLTAMADVFEHRLKGSVDAIKAELGDLGGRVSVPDDRKFIGLNAYQKAMDCLRPGDVVILATPPAFRWVHFGYAIQKGLNVFMEKPITVDGPTSRRMFALGEQAQAKNLKVGVGLMCRHCDARHELYDRIKNGDIGEIMLLRAYRMQQPIGYVFSDPKPAGENELLWQIQRFHSFLWASGGGFSDFLIHNIDECCWMKDAWPVRAQALGGRHYRGNQVDQNFDTYSVEYTFDDGAKLFLEGRSIAGCRNEFASYAHGTKGAAVISTASHSPAKCRIYKGRNIKRSDLVWAYPKKETSPYELEWDHLIDAIRHDKPYNEVQRGTEASLITSMGRMAAHTGQVITRDQMLNHGHEFAPDLDKLTMNSPAPLQVGRDGKYPIPQPGLKGLQEY